MLATSSRIAARRARLNVPKSLDGSLIVKIARLEQIPRVLFSSFPSGSLRQWPSNGALTRSYATTTTTTKKPRGRAPARARSTKRKTPKKKTKAKRAKAKPKRKAKPVLKRKVLTERQKLVATKAKARTRIQELKESALVSPKLLPQTAYLVYHSSRTTKGEKATTAAKEIGEDFKNLSLTEIERLNHIANQNKATNAANYANWVRSYTPQQINTANNARRLLNRTKDPKSRRRPLIKDERLPRQPTRSYIFFVKERWQSGDFHGMKVTDAGKLAGKEFKALSASEKKKYTDLQAADTARYQTETKTVMG